MANRCFRLFTETLLPAGFIYPEGIRNFAAIGDYPQIAPWWFLDAESEAGELVFRIRKHDGRNLVPFAKVDDGRGDVACFDGDDTGGDPAVLMLVLDESGRHYSFKNFGQWLTAAMADAQKSVELSDGEIIEAIRAQSRELSPIDSLRVLIDLKNRNISQLQMIGFFKEAFPHIPLRYIVEASVAQAVIGPTGISDDEFNTLLSPWWRA